MPGRDLPVTEPSRGVPQPRDLFSHNRSLAERPNATRDDARRTPRDLARELNELRDLSERESRVLNAVGQFRTIAVDDIAKSTDDRLLRNLKEDGLLRSHWLRSHGITKVTKRSHKRSSKNANSRPVSKVERLHVVTLTRKGAAWLRENGYDEKAHGKLAATLTKEREAFHDSRLYALAQKGLADLRATGNTPVAVHTDAVLKSRLHSATHQLQRDGMSKIDAQVAAASALQIPIVDGKAILPDVRIDYERENGQQTYTDLELLSDSYSKGSIAAKVAAGFNNFTTNHNGGFIPQGGGSPWDPDYMAGLLR